MLTLGTSAIMMFKVLFHFFLLYKIFFPESSAILLPISRDVIVLYLCNSEGSGWMTEGLCLQTIIWRVTDT